MTTSVKEALEALLVPAEHPVASIGARRAAYTTIRSFIEAEAAETECWRVIEEWQLHPKKRAQLTLGVGRFVVGLITSDAYYNAKEVECEGATRLEALQSAASWIKKEGSK